MVAFALAPGLRFTGALSLSARRAAACAVPRSRTFATVGASATNVKFDDAQEYSADAAVNVQRGGGRFAVAPKPRASFTGGRRREDDADVERRGPRRRSSFDADERRDSRRAADDDFRGAFASQRRRPVTIEQRHDDYNREDKWVRRRRGGRSSDEDSFAEPSGDPRPRSGMTRQDGDGDGKSYGRQADRWNRRDARQEDRWIRREGRHEDRWDRRDARQEDRWSRGTGRRAAYEGEGWGASRGRGRFDREGDDDEPSEVQEALASGDDLVYGLQSVWGALRAQRRTFHTLYVQTGERATKGGNDRLRKAIDAEAAGAALRVVHMDRGELNNLSGQRPHQGVVLRCGKLAYVDAEMAVLEDGAQDNGAVVLALDEVRDPQNLGALLRTAAYLGVHAVVVCARNSAPLSPAVSRASAGVAEALPVTAATSMPRFLREATSRGWRVMGADAGRDAVDLVDVEAGVQPTILVLGSEGEGLRTMVKQCCVATVRVERALAAPEQLDSLNVSVAGALVLFRLLR